MTIEEARASIGRDVVYRSPSSGHVVWGVITGVVGNPHWVLVRYGPDRESKATAADLLELVVR